MYIIFKCFTTNTDLEDFVLSVEPKLVEQDELKHVKMKIVYMNINCCITKRLCRIKHAKKCGKTFKGTFKQCLCEDVVSYHYEHPEIGIVVCPKCHHKLDKQYRRLTYYQKKQ